jgi:hypothetical protein
MRSGFPGRFFLYNKTKAARLYNLLRGLYNIDRLKKMKGCDAHGRQKTPQGFTWHDRDAGADGAGAAWLRPVFMAAGG